MATAWNRWIGGEAAHEGDWSRTANWSLAAVPVAGDWVRIPPGSHLIDAGLNQSTVQLAALYVDYGSPNIGSIGSALQVAADSVVIGQTSIASGLMTAATCQNIDFGSAHAAKISVLATGSGDVSTNGYDPLIITASNVNTTVAVSGTSYVGIGTDAFGADALIQLLAHSGLGRVTTGVRTAVINLAQNGTGSTVVPYLNGAGSYWCRGGDLYVYGDNSTVTAAYCYGGVLHLPRHAATAITSLYMRGGELDLLDNPLDVLIGSVFFRSGRIRQGFDNQLSWTDWFWESTLIGE
jgi:hypothetical protein